MNGGTAPTTGLGTTVGTSQAALMWALLGTSLGTAPGAARGERGCGGEVQGSPCLGLCGGWGTRVEARVGAGPYLVVQRELEASVQLLVEALLVAVGQLESELGAARAQSAQQQGQRPAPRPAPHPARTAPHRAARPRARPARGRPSLTWRHRGASGLGRLRAWPGDVGGPGPGGCGQSGDVKPPSVTRRHPRTAHASGNGCGAALLRVPAVRCALPQ